MISFSNSALLFVGCIALETVVAVTTTTLIFMLLVPERESEDHQNMISSLSRALVHEDVRESLHAAGSPEDIRGTLKEAVA